MNQAPFEHDDELLQTSYNRINLYQFRVSMNFKMDFKN